MGTELKQLSIYERWAAKVRVADSTLPTMDTPCWEWAAAVDNYGYGKLATVSRTIRQAHRVGYELNVGPIPPGMLVCHRCDNPKCVAPHHLFLGTHRDNSRDMVRKGRQAQQRDPGLIAVGARNGARSKPNRVARGDRHGSRTMPGRVRRGEQHGMSVATEALVRQARSGGYTVLQAAALLGIGRRAAHMVLSGKTWRHVL